MTLPRLYDTDEVAAILRVSKNWLYLRAGRSIPVTRISHRLLWTEEQISWIIEAAAIEPAVAFERVETRTRALPIPGRRVPDLPPTRTDVRQLRAKRRPPARVNNRNTASDSHSSPIPTADYTVSRLYRNQDGAGQ
ncbi:helix-turn-helix domain-containing protein [Nonomuraea turkmeniaca]|uniref:Helix-turn-helix domain-containing protein n=1 Tax=Nonomuraea turkmeniaca TaxID=103838 RepID=A0A5S4FG94_9ACTN|nr:helix-turn-helix domain-containing protein [Nonomuraea turkmeniaca]